MSTPKSATKRFAKRVAAFLALQLVVLLSLVASYRVERESFLAASLAKQRRLRESKSPRVLLVGGSCVALGFRSPLLAGALERDVVNLGMQGSLGLDIKLAEVGERVADGDLVVLSLEYHHYGGGIADGITMWGWLEQDWSRWRLLALGDGKKMLDTAHLYLRNVATSTIRDRLLGHRLRAPRPFNPASFNEYGDVEAHRGMASPGIKGGPLSGSVFSDDAFDEAMHALALFEARARERGAQVVIFLPPIARSRAEPILGVLQGIEERLRSGPIPVINTVESGLWADDRFFDTIYHLTYDASVTNTHRLLRALPAGTKNP